MQNASARRVRLKTVSTQIKPVVIDTGLLWLLGASGILLAGIAGVDREWTFSLHREKWPRLTSLMGRSLFDGEWIGSGDLSIIFLILVFICYLRADLNPACRLTARWRPHLGFILTAAFLSCFAQVQILKTLVGRARPHLPLLEGIPYSHWFEYGPLFFTDGIHHCSFPSGHTAVAFIFMAPAYVLAGNARYNQRTRMIGAAVGGFSLVNAFFMCLARSMSLNHWISDCLASVLFSWIIIHTMYFHVIRPADREASLSAQSRPLRGLRFWEVHLCVNLCVMLSAVLSVMIGVRAFIRHQELYLMGLMPMGCMIGLAFWDRVKTIYMEAMVPSD